LFVKPTQYGDNFYFYYCKQCTDMSRKYLTALIYIWSTQRVTSHRLLNVGRDRGYKQFSYESNADCETRKA